MAHQVGDQFQGADGNWYGNESDAKRAIPSTTSANFDMQMGGVADAAWFAVIGIKLYIWLIKKGVIPCAAIAAGMNGVLGIFYAMIAKAPLTSNPTAYWIMFGIAWLIGMVVWNLKKMKVIYAMCSSVVITVLYVISLQFGILDVPEYMWLTKRSTSYSSGSSKFGDFRYAVNNAGDGVIITKYTGKNNAEIVIPAEINGLPVTRIEGMGYLLNEYLISFKEKPPVITSVVIPDTVTYIGAFMYFCKGVTNITLPKSLKYIDVEAFQGSGLTAVVFPDGVTHIADGAFAGCRNLASVKLPSNLEIIGHRVFGSCPVDADIKIPSKVKRGFLFKESKYNQPNETSVFIEEMGSYFTPEN